MRLHEEFKEYENLWDDQVLVEDTEFRSEIARLRSTEKGIAELNNLRKTNPEEYKRLRAEDALVNPLNKLKNKKYVELDYDGFESESSKMVSDPGAPYGYQEIDTSKTFPSFTYKADVTDVIEHLDDMMDGTTVLEDDKANNELVKEYLRLKAIWEDTEHDTEEEAIAEENWDLFIYNNLDELVELFYESLLDSFKDRATDYALECVDPYDEWDVDWEED